MMENDKLKENVECEVNGNEASSMTYIKNKEASQGVSGQLFESKLTSLILYRLLKNDKVKEFYLGSNLDGIGDLDDVCIRLKHADSDKTALILIQAKHKDDPKKGITNSDLFHEKSDFNLKKAFNSLLKEKGNTKNKNRDFFLYAVDRKDVVPYCIFYTPAVNKITDRIKELKSCGIVKDLITTGSRIAFQINYNEDDIAKITNNESQRDDAVYFFKNLYFFTNQAQEEDVGVELENEIVRQNFKDTKNFQVRPDAVFLNFHKNVEKWWLKQGNVEYLTKSCDFLDKTLNQVINNAYLSILNYNSVNNLDLYPIEFNVESMVSIQTLIKKLGNEQRTILRIISNSVILSSIKIKQCLTKYLKTKKYSLIDYGYLQKIRKVEFEILLKEIENTDIDILVIICDITVKLIKEDMYQVFKAFNKDILLVTEESKIVSRENLAIETENDFILGLLDISDQEKVLEYIITVQGIEFNLNKIIDDDAKHIIDADILLKILKHDKIELGRSLEKREDDEDFIERKLMNASKTALDIELNILNDPIVVIIAEPGMGKSTLLTNKSMEMKRRYPKTWIARINLQDYSKDFFYRWQSNNLPVNLKETMLLICKAEISLSLSDKFDMNFNEKMVLINKGMDATSFMNLQLIAHSFNKRNILYILDGFDEVCPYYEKEAVEFINNLVNTFEIGNDVDIHNVSNEKVRHHIWITSRPYEAVRRTLEDFASPLSLTPLSKKEQDDFYKKFLQSNIRKEDLSNVKGFLKYVSENRHQKVTLSSMHLRVMYNAALEYLRKEFKNEEISKDSWILDTGESYFSKEQYEEALHLSGIPLHMKIYASHFVSVLKDDSKTGKWGLYVHTFKFYESFLETKLKKIYFVKKNRKNIYNPDIRLRYEEAREEFSEKHKKLAFYSFFYDVPDRYNKLKNIEDMDQMVDEIMKGEEKMGLIDGIYRGIPRFVHLAFAEYYAVEYISDMIKKKGKIPKLIIDFVMNCLLDNIGLAIVFEQKLKHDEKLLKSLSTDANKKSIFEVIINQSKSHYSLQKVLENNLKITVGVLIKSIDKELNKENITAFAEHIGGKFFIYSAFLKYEDHIKYVLSKIKNIDTLIIDHICDNIIQEMNNDMKIINKDIISKRLQELGFKNIGDKLSTVNFKERNFTSVE